MFHMDLLIGRRSGEVVRLGPAGIPGVMDLPRVVDGLYRSARVLRVFTFQPRELRVERVLALVAEGTHEGEGVPDPPPDRGLAAKEPMDGIGRR